MVGSGRQLESAFFGCDGRWTHSGRGDCPKLGNGVQMAAIQNNCKVKDEDDAVPKSGINSCGTESGEQALWVKVTHSSFMESQHLPYNVRRAGRGGPGLWFVCSGCDGMRECSQRWGRVAEGIRNQMTCSNPKALKG